LTRGLFSPYLSRPVFFPTLLTQLYFLTQAETSGLFLLNRMENKAYIFQKLFRPLFVTKKIIWHGIKKTARRCFF